ncbi:hypothetical protein E7T06_19005 [Deinococcus sp. Arct2-2]|uniref:DUF6069 family protein n=1 Tax=Deinococcus sp. Arct2-2 TaxID=2568653 RepID=UPI0010A31851|nr:DUF6069 family protein [Deinococcus sp. Arct2-2]THF67882.1 hypothetical protein E7T06_19005 [Deinococcus sp. Arct2-2]
MTIVPSGRLVPQESAFARTALTLVVAGAANVVVARLGAAAFNVPAQFLALQPGPVLFFTTIGVLGAAGVWAWVKRFSPAPVRWFQRVAAVTLLCSLIPDLLLFRNTPLDGTTPSAVVTLMVLHLVAYAVCVTVLPQRSRRPA